MKRKVTDLKPNEAILISNDDERVAILLLMDISNFKWNSGDAPFDRNIRTPYPYCLAYKFRSIDFIPSDGIRVVNKNSFYEAEMIYPATDFIGSEGERERGITIVKQNGEVISSETVGIESKLRKLKRYDMSFCSGDGGICEAIMEEFNDGDYVLWSDIEQLLQPHNTPTNEQR
jgi:hypothetical protein